MGFPVSRYYVQQERAEGVWTKWISQWWISKYAKWIKPKADGCVPLDFHFCLTACTCEEAVWYFAFWMASMVCMITFVFTRLQPAMELPLFAWQTERPSAQLLTCGKHIVLKRWQKRKWEVGLDLGQSTCLVLACRKGWCGWVSHGNFNSDFNVWKRACVSAVCVCGFCFP